MDDLFGLDKVPEPSHMLLPLPPQVQLETVPMLKALAKAGAALAELKGRAAAIPHQGILIDTLALQEAKASSEIENIVTTQDELFQTSFSPNDQQSGAAKEVARYRDALRLGYDSMSDMEGIISNNLLIEMYRVLKLRSDGFRVIPGTVLRNDSTGETVYVPPQDANQIVKLMTGLERFINEDRISSLDPLIKMALIHYQFESIHPFPDGNGRIGRILNVLYLVRCDLLETPILYLSRYINQTKGDYYRLLQGVRDDDGWQPWVLYMLEAVTNTAGITLRLVNEMRDQMTDMKRRMRKDMPRLYSQDLLNNLFRHPYTRIEFVAKDLNVTRQTATRYLDAMAEKGFVRKHRVGRSNYYINGPLVQLLMEVSGDQT